jgi:hypothetical protein
MKLEKENSSLKNRLASNTLSLKNIYRILGVKGILVGVVFVAYFFSNSHFCYSKWHFLTDNEFIESAIEASLREIDVPSRDPSEVRKILQKLNPKCCLVDRSYLDFAWSYIYALSNERMVFVWITYPQNMTLNRLSTKGGSTALVKSCGKVSSWHIH